LNESICSSTPAAAVYVPNPVVDNPAPPPPETKVTVTSVPDAVAVTSDPTKLIEVAADAT